MLPYFFLMRKFLQILRFIIPLCYKVMAVYNIQSWKNIPLVKINPLIVINMYEHLNKILCSFLFLYLIFFNVEVWKPYEKCYEKPYENGLVLV